MGLGADSYARSLPKEYATHEETVKAVRGNVDKGVAQTEKVYEIAWPERKLAIIGVSTLDPEYGKAGGSSRSGRITLRHWPGPTWEWVSS